MRIKLLLILFLVSPFFTFGQSEKVITGKIIVKDATPQGVHIINLVNEKEAISNAQGEFSILAKPDDLLVFSAIHLDYQRKIIELQDYNLGKITIPMTSKINQLDEVKIQKSNIDAVSLGILTKPAKIYTPAERRLKTATGLYASADAGTMMGGSIGLDPLLNWISGRTALLKSELEVEKKEFLLKKMEIVFAPEFYTDKLRIPADRIKAFEYYCVENKAFAEALHDKNKTIATFLIGSLAMEFKKLQDNEK